MDYLQVNITIAPLEQRELLYPVLAELGFDSFQETETGLEAFIPKEGDQDTLVESIKKHDWLAHAEQLEINVSEVPHTNWNAVWESNFEPISVGEALHIRAPFHEPESKYERELIIAPQMSFGTGHHETTWMMCSALLDMKCQGKRVLDMGSGTGILAILTEMLGAQRVLGIEIEAMAVQNAQENAALNHCKACHFVHGDASAIPSEEFDIIVANINRNILLQDLSKYAAVLAKGGALLLSGFYVYDNPKLLAAAADLGLELHKTLDRNDWSLLYLIKNA